MRALLLLPALVLVGCAQRPASQAAPPPQRPKAICDQELGQFAVGRDQTAPLVEEVRQRSGASTARVLRPGQVVTMEFNDQRVSVVVDAANRVTAVRCG